MGPSVPLLGFCDFSRFKVVVDQVLSKKLNELDYEKILSKDGKN
jgi:hypothetical protein